MRVSARGVLIFAVMVVITFGLVGSGVAGQKCTWKVTKLASPSTAAKGTFANDIANSGLIGGGWLDADLMFHAAYWKKGKAYDVATEIGLPADTTYSNILSVNAQGQMVGHASNASGAIYVAMLWNTKRETWQNLHPEDGGWVASEANGVNARGDAVGYVVEAPVDPDINPYGWWGFAYVWPKNDRDGYALPGTSDYYYSTCTGINSSGAIIGWGVTKTFEWHALMWKKSCKGKYELYDLQDEEYDGSDYIESAAYDLSERGEVVGRAWWDTLEPAEAYSWTKKRGIDALDADSEDYSIAWKAVGIYVAGGIGRGRVWFNSGISDKAVIWVKGKLEVVVDSIGDYKHCESASVNAKGTVVGAAFPDADDTDISSMFPTGFVAVKCKGERR